MSENNKQQMGDGGDNYAQAAQKAAEAARQFSQAGAAAGGEAAANAAAATVQAGVEGGKATAEVAAGAATGGPWGAILSAAWALRHTLYKVLIFVCLFFLFIAVALISLPSVVFGDPEVNGLPADATLFSAYDDQVQAVTNCVDAGYAASLAGVEQIISDGGYDYELSMEALINQAHESADYDVCYILAAYSASLEQQNTSKADMLAKLNAVADKMFPVTYSVKSTTRTVTNDDDTETTETVYYVECTIHPFDQSVIITAFDLDMDATYGQFNITYGEAVAKMAGALKQTIYGSLTGGAVPPLTDAELLAFLESLDCSAIRKELIRTALSLVGRVPYFWGGKSAPGWNEAWNTPRLVTSAGSSSSGTIRPYGLDCSGFVEWVYTTVGFESFGVGGNTQWDNATGVTAAELQPGDLGFKEARSTGSVEHILIYAGKDAQGNMLWVHCTSGSGVTLNSPSYVKYYRRVTGVDLESDILP